MANTKREVDKLWDGMRTAIDAAYAIANKGRDEQGTALRDYATDIHWCDATKELLRAETANERQHRRNETVRGFSAVSGAKLILLGQVASGARKDGLPDATNFLHFRITAMQAQVIGYLIRVQLTPQWFDDLAKLDYPKLMQEAGKR
jgi:hypothetical protein